MLQNVFVKFTKWAVLKKLIIREINDLIINSLGIIIFISFFIGAVMTIQTALNVATNPLLPDYIVGYASRVAMILEFSPTFVSIIIAGRIGSFITSSIGTMKVTEQIDALKVMGVNPYNYLIFPKIIALSLYPFLTTLSMFLGILGGYVACVYGGYSSIPGFMNGLQLDFSPFNVFFAYIKSFIFAMLIATIPSYHGYYLKGGALDVGKASTTSFVWTSMSIIFINYLITELLLS